MSTGRRTCRTLLPVSPPTVLDDLPLGRQLGASPHWFFTSLIPEHLGLVDYGKYLKTWGTMQGKDTLDRLRGFLFPLLFGFPAEPEPKAALLCFFWQDLGSTPQLGSGVSKWCQEPVGGDSYEALAHSGLPAMVSDMNLHGWCISPFFWHRCPCCLP